MIETLGSGNEKSKDWADGESVTIYRSPDGQFWYEDGGEKKTLTDAERRERNRQQARGSDADPSRGMPKFNYGGERSMDEAVDDHPGAEPAEPSSTEPAPEPDTAKAKPATEPASADPTPPAAKAKDAGKLPKKKTRDPKSEPPANPGAKGIFRTDLEPGSLKKIGDKYYVKVGRAVREATPDEIATYDVMDKTMKETIAATERDRKERERGRAGASSEGTRDSVREDRHEAGSAESPSGGRRHMDHDIPEANRKFKESLARVIDPKLLEKVDGRYTFPGSNFTFSKEQVKWMRGDAKKPFPADDTIEVAAPRTRKVSDVLTEEPEERDAARGDRRRLASSVLEGGGGGDLARWSVHIKEFKGLKPVSWEKLLHGRDEKFFGMLLQSVDPSLAQSIFLKAGKNGTPTAEELAFLNYCSYDYAARTQKVESLQQNMSLETLKLVAKRDPALQSIVDRDPSKALEMLRRNALHLGMQDIVAFKEMYDSWLDLDHFRHDKRFVDWEKKIRKFCSKQGISIEEYDERYGRIYSAYPEPGAAYRRQKEIRAGLGWTAWVLDSAVGGAWSGTKADKEVLPPKGPSSAHRLQKEIRKNMSRLGWGLDTVVGGAWSGTKADREARIALKLNQRLGREYVTKVDDELQTLAKVLRATFVENESVRWQVFQEALYGKPVVPMAEQGPHTLDEAQNLNRTEALQIHNRLTTFAQSYVHPSTGKKWDYLTQDERREALEGLRFEYSQKQRSSGRGFFASVLSTLWGTSFDQKYNELISKETKPTP